MIEAAGGDQQQVWTSRKTDTDQQQTKYKREREHNRDTREGKTVSFPRTMTDT